MYARGDTLYLSGTDRGSAKDYQANIYNLAMIQALVGGGAIREADARAEEAVLRGLNLHVILLLLIIIKY